MMNSTNDVPILHKDCFFSYLDERGDAVRAIGVAEYYDDYTVLMHTGSSTVRADLLAQDIVELSFGGDLFRVRHLTPSADGCPRFKIPKGYGFFFPRDDVEREIGDVDGRAAPHPRQLTLSECEYIK